MKTILTIRALLVMQLGVFCSLVSLAQEHTPQLNSVYLKPLKSVDFLNEYPRISLGTDGHITKNWYYDLSIAYGDLNIYKTVVFDENLKRNKNEYAIFDIQPTFKLLIGQKKTLSTFLGASLLYTKRQVELKNSYYYSEGSKGGIDYDAARMHDNRIGRQIYFESNLSFENIGFSFYTTCGLAFAKIKYTNVKNPQIVDFSFVEWWERRTVHEGNLYPFQLTFGLKIHFILNAYKKFQSE